MPVETLIIKELEQVDLKSDLRSGFTSLSLRALSRSGAPVFLLSSINITISRAPLPITRITFKESKSAFGLAPRLVIS